MSARNIVPSRIGIATSRSIRTRGVLAQPTVDAMQIASSATNALGLLRLVARNLRMGRRHRNEGLGGIVPPAVTLTFAWLYRSPGFSGASSDSLSLPVDRLYWASTIGVLNQTLNR
jgi:hypothetical protein